MIGVALALVVVGIVLLFIFPWAGVPLGIVGLLLLIAFLIGFARRAEQGRP